MTFQNIVHASTRHVRPKPIHRRLYVHAVVGYLGQQSINHITGRGFQKQRTFYGCDPRRALVVELPEGVLPEPAEIRYEGILIWPKIRVCAFVFKAREDRLITV